MSLHSERGHSIFLCVFIFAMLWIKRFFFFGGGGGGHNSITSYFKSLPQYPLTILHMPIRNIPNTFYVFSKYKKNKIKCNHNILWLSTLCPFPSMHWGTYNQNGCIVCGMAFNIVAIFSNLVSCHFKMTLFLCLKQSCFMYQNLRYCILLLLLLLLFCLNIIEQIKYKRKTVNGASFTSIKRIFASTENVTVIISRGCQVCGLFCVCCAPHVFPVTQFFPHVDCLI